jgi:hypothetical protein
MSSAPSGWDHKFELYRELLSHPHLLNSFSASRSPKQRAEDFLWVFEAMWRPKQTEEQKFRFEIPETLLFRKGKMTMWLFTSKDGVILKHHSKDTISRVGDTSSAAGGAAHAVEQRLVHASKQFADDLSAGGGGPVSVARTLERPADAAFGSLPALRTLMQAREETAAWLEKQYLYTPDDAVALQGYVMSHAPGEQAVSYSVQYRRDANGKGLFGVFRRWAAQAAAHPAKGGQQDGRAADTLVRASNVRLQRALVPLAQALLNRLESHHRQTVVGLHAEFVIVHKTERATGLGRRGVGGSAGALGGGGGGRAGGGEGFDAAEAGGAQFRDHEVRANANY